MNEDSGEQYDNGKVYDNQEGSGNFVEEHYPDPHQDTNDIGPQTNTDDNSFHVDKLIEKIQNNPQFSQRENEFSQKIDDLLRSKTGRPFSAFSGYVFLANKILLITTFSEFLFQRFDIVTLFLNLVIIFIESGIFNQKHLYKWLMVLIGSLLLDALVLLDISPVS